MNLTISSISSDIVCFMGNHGHLISYKFRIKDSNSRNNLSSLSGSCNHMWNLTNEMTRDSESFLSEFDVNNLTKGFCKTLKIHSTTVQEINKTHATCRRKAKKSKLSWRSAKNGTLGWIPFKASAVKIDQDNCSIIYMGQKFRYYNSRNFSGKVVTGCFFQKPGNKWYISLQIRLDEKIIHEHLEPEVGIDLGVKNKIALSDGSIYTRDSITKKYEKALAAAQRSGKKKRVQKIHEKIKNSREDWAHKVTTNIAKKYKYIAIGDFKVKKLIGDKSPINKALLDCAPYQIISYLKYKSNRVGGETRLVKEDWTTQTCSSCFELTGPKGAKNLSVREWTCKCCGTQHLRDQNAGKTILIFSKYPALRPKGQKAGIPYRALYAETSTLKDVMDRESPSYLGACKASEPE
jgi:putative transposase